MSKTIIETDLAVSAIFDAYPKEVRSQMERLRKLVLETAEDSDPINRLTETLKWGEPSYVTKHGSTLRMDWKEKNPGQYAMYFQCTSRLVPSFKMAFPDLFKYDGSRAIVFSLDENIPEKELKLCINAALTYHKVKKLPLLGL